MEQLKIVKESKRSQKKEEMYKYRAKEQGKGLKPKDTTL